MKTSVIHSLVLLAVLLLCPCLSRGASFFGKLQEKQTLHGFEVANIYLNGSEKVIGARFAHQETGFLLDLFTIQSVPQGFFWVNTPPATNMGEPHTCEHLLLGKGTKGKSVAALEDMRLGESTAYTSRLYTAYSFSCVGGDEAFFELLDAKLDALVHPTFSDEEIRREVAHIGILEDPEKDDPSLVEKGTVYTEMVSSFEKPWSRLYAELLTLGYGEDHPLAHISGGHPSAIRNMEPSDMRAFHAREYHLHNMGLIAALPGSISPRQFLKHLSTTLTNMQDPAPSGRRAAMNVPLPDPKPAAADPAGLVHLVEYPNNNEQEPGSVIFLWPPRLELDAKQGLLLDTFLYCFGGSQTSNLYNVFVNSATRKKDFKASSVFASKSDEIGRAVTIGIFNVDPAYLNEEAISTMSGMIRDELSSIAALDDGSAELAAFNARARNYLEQTRKDTANYLNTPPGFGMRSGNGGGWYRLLRLLERNPGFKKSLLMKDELALVEKELRRSDNLWKPLIDQWRLLETEPFAVAARPSSRLYRTELEGKKERLAAFTRGLMQAYGLESKQEAIRRYRKQYEENTARIAAAEKEILVPGFLPNPPLSYDEQLDYKVRELPGGAPLIASTFDSMLSASMGIAFRLDGIAWERLIYLPILPQLVTEIGATKDGTTYDYARMNEALKQEVLSLSGRIDLNADTGRVELVVAGQGGDLGESQNALRWMRAGILDPYLEPDNLPRIADVTRNRLAALRNRMKSSEESWVQYPAMAYRNQESPLVAAAGCFLTQEHFLHRLKWRLTGAPAGVREEEITKAFDGLALKVASMNRQALVNLAGKVHRQSATEEDDPAGLDPVLAALSPAGRPLIVEALDDLAAVAADIPDATLPEDARYLVQQMKEDLLYGPQRTLADIKDLWRGLRSRNNVRAYLVSNRADQRVLEPLLRDLVGSFSGDSPQKQVYPSAPFIHQRMASRYPDMEDPTYVGLINGNTRNGVLLYYSPLTGLRDTDEERLLDFLASKLYGGGGAHGFFMKTWGAGLAYSNGVGSSEKTGRIQYYAERCPDVTATMRFVVDLLKNAAPDERLADYAIAQVFAVNRGSRSYEARATAMAEDLADGYTPQVVREFRSAVLALSRKQDLYSLLAQRMEKVYGRILTGYGQKLASVEGGDYFMIGPEFQFELLEKYVENTEGPQPVYRLYPRDFWITTQR